MNNSVKTIIRNFKRRPLINLINLAGLSVSLALIIILSVYGYNQLTTDNYHINGDQIYLFGKVKEGTHTPGILKENIDARIPEVKASVRIESAWEPPVFQSEGHEPITSDLIFADEDFFNLFMYKAVEGNLESALKQPSSIVITKSLADKLFGLKPALGKIIKLNNNKDLTVTAVIREPEKNSCISFNAIASINTKKAIEFHGEGEFTEWGWCNFQTFILLKQNAKPDEINKKIITLFPKDHQKHYKESTLLSLKDIYFSDINTNWGAGYIKTGDLKKIIILIMVAILVLIIALINFINISSSQWIEKVRQTGIKKLIGSSKQQIFRNIIFEASLLFFLALFIAIILVIITHPFIQNYTGIHFNRHLLIEPGFFILSITGATILSLLSSLIPAFRISSSKALDNLRKRIESSSSNFSHKGILVAVQFTIAIVLIAFTLIVQKQVNFGSSNLGFNQDNIIAIKLTQQLYKKKDVLKKMLSENPSIDKISLSQFYPGKPVSKWGTKLLLNGEQKDVDFNTFSADPQFFDLMSLKVISGRLYTDNLSDKGKIIVNEKFLQQHNLANPIGGKLQMSIEGNSYEIIGVIKNFHFKPINEPIAPLAIRNDQYASHCMVNLKTVNFNSLQSTIQDIKSMTWKLSPSFPVEISFVDQAIESMYRSELQFRRSFSIFSVCSIVICCLGILAMSLFACQQRIKEIGVRKVNGAKIFEILAMLNVEVIKWVIIAFIIAMPIAWYSMHQWLLNFAYKTELSWWIFVAAGAVAFSIAIFTITLQSWRAATRNPVEALRYE